MADLFRFISWYLIVTVLGWIAFPIAYGFFPNLKSKGFALSKPLGLLLWGFLFWLLGSLGILQNNLGGVILAFLLLGVGVWLALKNGKANEIREWVKENKKSVLVMEILFFIAFGFWTIVRAANPEASATEKPMELAFINSILQSSSMPPQDPWLSGYAISYYYFGYILVSMLIRVSGVASSIGFNLSIALWFGLTALAVYGIVFDLLAKGKESLDEKQTVKLARVGGFFGPIYVLVISCFEGVLEFLYSGGVFWKSDSQGNLTSKFWSWLNITELDVPPSLPFDWLQPRPSGWLWWRGSRVIQDLSLTNNKIEVIQEFPFFSYLLADLHPHVLAMPFVVLAVGLALNVFVNPDNLFVTSKSILAWFKHWEFWVSALIIGSLAFLNTWDFPIYVGLFCLVLSYLRIKKHGWGWTRLGEFVKYGLVMGVTGGILFLPFYLGFKSQAGGILPSMEFMTRGIHFWILFGGLLIPISIWLIVQAIRNAEPKKIIKTFMITLGIFLAILLIMLLVGIAIFGLEPTAMEMAKSATPLVTTLGLRLQQGINAFIGLHGTSDVGLVTGQALLRRIQAPGTWITLLLIITAALIILFGKKRIITADPMGSEEHVKKAIESQSIYFVGFLILIGAALTTFPEFFYLRDNFGTRMNTIFKFYFQAWILWGIAAAYASADLLIGLKRVKRIIFSVALLLSLAAGLAYPVNMILTKTNQFKPIQWTLDGNAYIAAYTPEEYAAMQWLAQQPVGVVAEAIGGSYSEYARVSTRTGLPTILGWPGHEGQWRGGYTEVGSRESEIKQLYQTSDWGEAQFYIRKYNIRYIYYGNLEKSLYGNDDEVFRQNLPVVYENSGVTIFSVADEEGVFTP